MRTLNGAACHWQSQRPSPRGSACVPHHELPLRPFVRYAGSARRGFASMRLHSLTERTRWSRNQRLTLCSKTKIKSWSKRKSNIVGFSTSKAKSVPDERMLYFAHIVWTLSPYILVKTFGKKRESLRFSKSKSIRSSNTL